MNMKEIVRVRESEVLREIVPGSSRTISTGPNLATDLTDLLC